MTAATEEAGLRVCLYAMVCAAMALPVVDVVGPIVRAIAEACSK